MKPVTVLTHEFVEFIPEVIRDGSIYVCIPFSTVVHKCCCGCGHEVVTPLSPTDWKLIFDGVSVSLHPSIGNWSFPCQAHYWIQHDRVFWADRWSQSEIDAGRSADATTKARYYREEAEKPAPQPSASEPTPTVNPSSKPVDTKSKTWWRRLFGWLFE